VPRRPRRDNNEVRVDGVKMAVLIAKYCICIICVGVGGMAVNIRTLEI